MAQPAEVVDAVVAAHIPSDVVGVSHHDLGNGRSPRTSANDGYSTAFV